MTDRPALQHGCHKRGLPHRIDSRKKWGYVETGATIAVFPILADVVEVKKGSRSTATWSNDFIRLNRWLRNSFAQLITPLDIDSIGQNWEDSNTMALPQKMDPLPFPMRDGCKRAVSNLRERTANEQSAFVDR